MGEACAGPCAEDCQWGHDECEDEGVCRGLIVLREREEFERCADHCCEAHDGRGGSDRLAKGDAAEELEHGDHHDAAADPEQACDKAGE